MIKHFFFIIEALKISKRLKWALTLYFFVPFPKCMYINIHACMTCCEDAFVYRYQAFPYLESVPVNMTTYVYISYECKTNKSFDVILRVPEEWNPLGESLEQSWIFVDPFWWMYWSQIHLMHAISLLADGHLRCQFSGEVVALSPPAFPSNSSL